MRIAVEAEPVGEHEAGDGEVAAIDVADGERAAAEEAGAGIGGQELRRATDGIRPDDAQSHVSSRRPFLATLSG